MNRILCRQRRIRASRRIEEPQHIGRCIERLYIKIASEVAEIIGRHVDDITDASEVSRWRVLNVLVEGHIYRAER